MENNNETVVLVKRKKAVFGFAIRMKVWIDGNLAAKSIRIGQEVELKVPNGEHTICAGTSKIDKGNSITFNADGNKLFFLAQPSMGKASTVYSLKQVENFALAETIKPETIALEPVETSNAELLERDIKNIEEQMRVLKPKIAEASKSGDNDSVSQHQASLGNYNLEIIKRIKALKGLTGQGYTRTVSAWSMGRKSDIGTAVLSAIVLGAIGITLTVLTDIEFFIQTGIVGGMILGFLLGHYVPVYNTGRKKTNLALTILLTLVMGVGLLYSVALIPFLPDQVFRGRVPLLIVSLATFFVLPFVAVRLRIKSMIIVLSIIVTVSYINFILVLSVGKSIISLIFG